MDTNTRPHDKKDHNMDKMDTTWTELFCVVSTRGLASMLNLSSLWTEGTQKTPTFLKFKKGNLRRKFCPKRPWVVGLLVILPWAYVERWTQLWTQLWTQPWADVSRTILAMAWGY